MLLRFLWPEVEQLGAADRLSGDHVMIADWLLRRDLGCLSCTSFSMLGPSFTASAVEAVAESKVVNPVATEKVAEFQQRVAKILQVSGLLGFPIWSLNGGAGLEHWTLLVIKQIAGGGKILRYYDSSRSESPFKYSKVKTTEKYLERKV